MRLAVLVLCSASLLLLVAMPPTATRAGPRPDPEPSAKAPEHLVLVLLGGGVTLDEMRDEKTMPTVAGWAANGASLALGTSADAPHAGAHEILTGREARSPLGQQRPEHPTVMEVVRVARDLPPQAVFLIMADDSTYALAWSTHAAFGAGVAPRTATGAGAFGAPLAPLLERLGRPLPTEPAAWALLTDLRRRSGQAAGPWLPDGVDAATPEAERIERALLSELDRRTLLVRGPIPKDDAAVRAAITVLRVHRPRLLVLRLSELQGALEPAARIVRRAAEDAALARLARVVGDDPRLAGRTTLVVVGEPHASPRDRTRPAAMGFVARGPVIRRARRSPAPPRLVDVGPTVAEMLGVAMPTARGRVLSEVLR